MKFLKRCLSVLCAVAVFCLSAGTASAAQTDENYLDGKINALLEYEYSLTGTKNAEEFVSSYLAKNAGTSASDWFVIALSKNGGNFGGKAYAEALKSAVSDIYSKDIDKAKITDLQRIALAYTACGGDILNINGINLLENCTYGRTVPELSSQGITTLTYALLVLDSKDYYVSKNSASGRNEIIAEILSKQQDSGGFSVSGNGADPDVTAMVITALAPYVNESESVKNAVDRALVKLSSMQKNDGSFASYGKVNCESCAQVIVALTALEIDPQSDSRFIKNGSTVLDAMLSFQLGSGGFAHLQGGKENQIACYEAMYALTAYKCFLKSGEGLYDFSAEENTKSAASSRPAESEASQSNSNQTKETSAAEKASTGPASFENNGSSQTLAEAQETAQGNKSTPNSESGSADNSVDETNEVLTETPGKTTSDRSTADGGNSNGNSSVLSLTDSAKPQKSGSNSVSNELIPVILCCLPLIACYGIIYTKRRKSED